MNHSTTEISSYSNRASAAAVLVAAGSSSRMNGDDKIFLDLCSRPIIEHSLSVFMNSGLFETTILVLSKNSINLAHDKLSDYLAEGLILTTGGARRQDSVLRGLEKIQKTPVVAIHDGARPCITQSILEQGLEKVEKTGAAIPVIPITDTVKRLNDIGRVETTLPRKNYKFSQTPQFFDLDLIRKAHRKIIKDVTDDASMIEMIGGEVEVFDGDIENLKITTSNDLVIARNILEARK
ncbi:MAG: 2-C-methyl-D-erythritol 4-phosphate cytidylyltransferase [SAR202 cluster bacterium]|nr:2-C-methyl-D-erythritol 4-phosphate cytidylyltransferase [SAR202 cluster bacterium]|tara:strand:+ start:19 stop:729 length:711 start_codon:yes stop_codon:yes gene_type:complete